MEVKICSLNLCLGLANKKDLVKQIINNEKIDIMCVQETELITNLDHNLLSFPGFNFESEICTSKSRVGTYINSSLKYVRRSELEGVDCHIVILDISSKPDLRIINLYRSFNPPNNQSAREFFNCQLRTVRRALTSNTVLIGDFNLDLTKKGIPGYAFASYFDDLDLTFDELNLAQLVDFPTWTRTVGGAVRESSIDHVYSTNPAYLSSVSSFKPCFGDHFAITLNYSIVKEPNKFVYRRTWKHYSKERLIYMLSAEDWDIMDDTVQGYWNSFEHKLINIVDSLIPMSLESNNEKNMTVAPRMKNLINRRKRMVKKMKTDKSLELRNRVKTLNTEIKTFFNNKKTEQVRRTIKPGNSQSLWKPVKIAKDVNLTSLPKSMYENHIEIPLDKLPDRFASFFYNKIEKLLEEVNIDENIHNGLNKVTCTNFDFMDMESVISCMKSLKTKNSEGFDRIPQKVLVDGTSILAKPMHKLMSLIYKEKQIPDQWLVAKTLPIFKNKGQSKDIENYRPIANLCSSSKIFEKLILKRILQIESDKKIDFTGSNQHGFKRKCSTSTLSSALLSQISRALDNEEYVIVASLDLSSAFDLVNIDLLIKRLKIVGLPKDVIDLISVWLRNRSFYVNINEVNSVFFDLHLGTVQGSILGPVLYAIFVSPMFDIAEFSAFADDTFIPKSDSSLPRLIVDIEKTLEQITKWLEKSGLIVNQAKTESCLFYKKDCAPVYLNVGDSTILTKKSINVLGVTFDSKLQWSEQVSMAVQKSNRSLNALKIISKFFNTTELITLVTSNFFSVLLYNSEIWQSANLKAVLQQTLLSASAKALRMCLHYPKNRISNLNIHKITNRATPSMHCKYKCALQLYKLFNECSPYTEWCHLNFDIINTSRQHYFEIRQNHNLRIGKNALCNKLHNLNGTIPLEWLNLSFDNYKIKCKNKLLTFV